MVFALSRRSGRILHEMCHRTRVEIAGMFAL